MKLIYLFYIEYIAEYNSKTNQGFKPDPAGFCGYHFEAWPNGPVENIIYSNLPYIKAALSGKSERYYPEWIHYGKADQECLDEALNRLKKQYLSMTQDQIVDFTHDVLCEWKRTSSLQEMKFPQGCEEECRRARNAFL